MGFFKNIFYKKTKPLIPDNHRRDLAMIFDTLRFWTPELIEWIARENDPIVLSCTSHLINCGGWPDYLPSKPEGYPLRDKSAERDLQLNFSCELLNMLSDKSDMLSPGLSKKIWLTEYYKTYYEKTTGSIPDVFVPYIKNNNEEKE